MSTDSTDSESDSVLSEASPSHWAYKKGFSYGLKEDRLERGMMRFGLLFAADQETTYNTRQWLAGFYYGLQQFRERGAARQSIFAANQNLNEQANF